MPVADDLVEAFEPWITDDLETYLRAIGGMFATVEEFIDATEDGALLDPDRCPAAWLPYLAQYVGERLPVGIDEAAAREWIKDHPNQRRGTTAAIFRATQRRLTGGRLVTIIERDGDDDTLTVVTYTDQTPDPDGTLRDIEDVAPADLDLNYQVVAGEIWSQVKTGFATWTAVKAANATWADVATARPGSDTFARTRP